MARQPRLDFPGAIHHVMNRGANHQGIFGNDLDRDLLIRIWAIASERFGIEVICYCWMGNHFHVLVRCPDAQLSKTMQFVNRSYTQQFNHFHERDGALYRGRFHSVLVDEQSHFDHVTRYIHLNPTEAGIRPRNQVAGYRWGTYDSYIGLAPAPAWVRVDLGLQSFEGSASRYRSFVEGEPTNAAVDRFYARPMSSQRVLGTQQFMDQISATHGLQTTGIRAGIPDYSLDEIDAAIALAAGTSPNELREHSASNHPRAAAALLARELADLSTDEAVDRYSFVSQSAATTAVSAVRNGLDPRALAIYSAAKQALTSGV